MRALRLWKGEQVDGTVLEPWEAEEDGFLLEHNFILALPSAVLAGWRYLTSLKSTPRFVRAPMYWSLFNKGLYM